MPHLESAPPILTKKHTLVEAYYVPRHNIPRTLIPCFSTLFKRKHIAESELEIPSATHGTYSCKCGEIFNAVIL